MSVLQEDEEDFGPRPPALHELISKILKEYPSGQVFKEIIQNADDASATKVKFFIDCRHIPTLPLELLEQTSLFSQRESRFKNVVDQFEGPALMSYNNAPFTDANWKSIQTIQQSDKAQDLCKTGKFGIGFNSVYHLTDLPVILSGKYCGYFEPQKQVWEEQSGKRRLLSKLHASCPRALEPFHVVEGFSSNRTNFKDGTIFRFPLRKKPSQLSRETHSLKDIRELLRILTSEAENLLLFLRSVCSIEIIEISKEGKVSTVFEVSVSPENMKSHQSLQKELVDWTRLYDYSKDVIIKKEFLKVVRNDRKEPSSWLIVNRLGSSHDNTLTLAQQQHTFPWVSTAIELDLKYDRRTHNDGRIYCLLPLPVEERVPFFINVNATFAISSNRRSINWKSQERQDIDGTWNKLLVENCFPECFLEMIKELAKGTSHCFVYDCWPVVSKVECTPWKGLLEPLYAKLLSSKAAVYTSANGQWIPVCDGLFVPQGVTLSNTVKQVLTSSKMKLVELPSEQWSVVSKYYKYKLCIVTPSVLRSTMKKNRDVYTSLSWDEKFDLFDYCISDNNYSDLVGLELIPLSSGSYRPFGRANESIVFVCPEDIRHHLLPGLEHMMVDVDNDSHRLLLFKVCNSGCTQLVKLDESFLAKHIPQSMCVSQWTELHIRQFWEWLKNHNIEVFRNLQILPYKKSKGETGIKCLSMCSNVVYVPLGLNLDTNLREGLEQVGIHFTCASDFPYVVHHELSSVLPFFKPEAVYDFLPRPEILQSQCFSAKKSFAIQTFFSSMASTKEASSIVKLYSMPIFFVVQDKKKLYPVFRSKSNTIKPLVQNGEYLCEYGLHVLPHNHLVFKCDQPLLNGLELLNWAKGSFIFINEVDYLIKYIFCGVKNRSFPNECVADFMLSVLDNLNKLISRFPRNKENLLQELSTLPFVSFNEGSTYKAPSSLFDPRDPVLSNLFKEQPVFPSKQFIKYIDQLALCGLKGLSDVTESNLIDIISRTPRLIDSNILYCKVSFERFEALFNFINKLPSKSANFYSILAQRAVYLPILPIASGKPLDYPCCLAWKGSSHLKSLTVFNPGEVVLKASSPGSIDIDPRIIGSEAVFVYDVPSPLHELLSRQVSPDTFLGAVLKHFKHVLDKQVQLGAPMCQSVAIETYRFLSSCKTQLTGLHSIGKWVWIDSHSIFVVPEACALTSNSHFGSSSLEPFIHILPKSMQSFRNFLCSNGVNETLSTKQIVGVLQSIKDAPKAIALENALTLIKRIFEWIVINNVESKDILIPVKSRSNFPELFPVGKVCYSNSTLLKEIAEASCQNVNLVHPTLESFADQLLQMSLLVPLSDVLNITEEIFEDVGQEESLTNRLKNILSDYKDGITIIKELIQNADDAGAMEVNILYDGREHNTEKLLFKGMAGACGPALVVHNDKMFSKDDFKNITKLGGATKKDQPLKIGKFGEGFCSVYHITDIPSFVSNEWLYIFDPTLAHLKEEVQNPYQPGKRVQFTSSIVSQMQQMAPYEGLFGFTSSKQYTQTMFRFPFRKRPSEISATIYNEKKIEELKRSLIETGKDLLLFLSHVKKIRLSSLSSHGSDPCEELIIERHLNSEGIVVMKTVISSKGRKSVLYEHWLIRSDSSILSENKPQVASVACQLRKSSNHYTIQPLDHGLVFCFLPLSVPPTGLPVHVSANFAVMRNRSGIWATTASSQPSDKKEHWNQQLMLNAIPRAYCNLLLALKELHVKGKLFDYTFYSLVPLVNNLSFKYPWSSMVRCLYSLLLEQEVFYSNVLSKWLCVKECLFVVSGILSNKPCMTPKCVIDSVSLLKLPVINLPSNFLDQLMAVAHDGQVTVHTLDLKTFCYKFFSNMKCFSRSHEIRNDVFLTMLLYAAASESDDLISHLKKCPCVPCGPNGVKVKMITDLVDPESDTLKHLFDEDGEYFPMRSFTEKKQAYQFMVNLGLLRKTLPWELVFVAAESVQELLVSNEPKALKRVKCLIEVIKINLDEGFGWAQTVTGMFERLKKVDFLPVAPIPSGYILPWKGKNKRVVSPSRVFYSCDVGLSMLLGTSSIIVNSDSLAKGGCGSIPLPVLEKLSIRTLVDYKDVLENFTNLVTIFMNRRQPYSKEELVCIDNISKSVYSFLEKKSAYKGIEYDLSQFRDQPFVWNGKIFISPSSVSQGWALDGPYLYSLPAIMSMNTSLIKCLDIKKRFSVKVLLGTFKTLLKDNGNRKLPGHLRQLVDTIIYSLNSHSIQYFLSLNKQDIVLPSDHYELLPASELSLNTEPWLSNEGHRMVHRDLNLIRAYNLGVVAIRDRVLEEYKSGNDAFGGIPFGQRESLTQRIRNILTQYPFGIAILKELLQNADDAKASKFYVILDQRNHGTVKLPSENWKDLQGPALLIWNNQNFTDDDLKGIQRLGLGSKRANSESIGQFGIGFNVVYHLTDCPSFYTRGDTLCVLDPHCQYIDKATESSPGRCFTKLDEKFWSRMSDLQSPFLINDRPEGLPVDLNGGTLFRFPLRNRSELMSESELVTEQAAALLKEPLETHLSKWTSEIKDAFLFLNNVLCFKFYVIKNNQCILKSSHELSSTNQLLRAQYFKILEQAKKKKQEKHKIFCPPPFFIPYPLTITSFQSSGNKHSEEKWLIQLGVGDMDTNIDIHSEFPTQLSQGFLPKHGIALPLGVTARIETGRLFCFLPLPDVSGLPMHINGQFWLADNRRSLWSGDVDDSRVKWNRMLIHAIASSYIRLVTQFHSFFVSNEGHLSEANLDREIEKYYSIFPYKETYESVDKQMMKECRMLSDCFFEKLFSSNANVLAYKTFSTRTGKHVVQWNPIKNEADPYSQLYCVSSPSEKDRLAWLLDIINMRTSCAPYIFYQHLKNLMNVQDHFKVSQDSIFKFYVTFQDKIFNRPAELLTSIRVNETPFRNEENFAKFLRYVTNTESFGRVFVVQKINFDSLLLLTADNIIRPFIRYRRVVCSDYHYLFPESWSVFLHPSLVELKLSPKYFSGSIPFSDIDRILKANFPSLLRPEADQASIEEKTLQLLWKCFQDEIIFKEHECEILKSFALIPATNGRLYTSSSLIRPLYYELSVDTEWKDVFKVLKSINFPLLLHDYNKLANKFCHHLSCFNDMVLLFAELQEKYKIFTSTLPNGWSDASILLKYMGGSSFKRKKELVQKMKTLPLFMTTDSRLVSLADKDVYMYVCESMCNAGFKNWAANYVFLSNLSWLECFSESDFEYFGKKLDVFSVYNKFIFPKFKSFSHEERKEHLLYIRDVVFMKASHASKGKGLNLEEWEKSTAAKLFITSLVGLECLESEGSPGKLFPVSHFVDNTVPVFQKFKNNFNLLSTEFDDEDWIEFFKLIELRTKLTFNEFVKLCNELSSGRHKDICEASKVLVEYFYSDKALPWYKDDSKLNEIKNICFIVVPDLSSLAWIHPPCQAPSVISSAKIHLTKFENSAIFRCAPLLWTVTAVADLPLPSEEMVKHCVFEKLGVIVTPSPNQIFENIINISKSPFAKFELFFKYYLRVHNTVTLLEVLSRNISQLFQLEMAANNFNYLKQLRAVRCIPVPLQKGSNQCVLVNSYQVVRLCSCESDSFLQPHISFLEHHLSEISFPLETIGVNQVITFDNIQYFFEQAYNYFTEEEITPNEMKYMTAFIVKLHALLSQCDMKEAGKALKPLYLPSAIDGSALLPISSLLFIDTKRYRRHDSCFNLLNTEFSLFRIPTTCSLTEDEFCLALPKLVRPQGLSVVCEEKVIEQTISSTNGDLYQHFLKLKNFIKPVAEVLKKILYAEFRETNNYKELADEFISCFISLMEELKIIPVANLKVSVFLKDKEIAKFKESYVLQPSCSANTNACTLFIDDLANARGHVIWKDISHSICLLIGKYCKQDQPTTYLSYTKYVSYCLNIENYDDLRQVIEDHEIEVHISDLHSEGGSKHVDEVSLGSCIPQKWHHCLDKTHKSFLNIFRTQEWVAYETEEDTYVWAMILYSLSGDASKTLTKRYQIITREGHEEGFSVSVLNLYKISSRSKNWNIDFMEHNVEPMETSTSIEENKELQMKVCHQLIEVLKIRDGGERKKGLQRLCDAYHPRSIENPCEKRIHKEAFEFLKKEVQALNDKEIGKIFLKRAQSIEDRQNSPRESISFTIPVIKPNKDEAQRWLQQAESDFIALRILKDGLTKGEKVACQVLFMAHEVVEKGLKAALYATSGVSEFFLKKHNLTPIANAICSERPEFAQLKTVASKLEPYYLETRFPNLFPCPLAPVDVHRDSNAEDIFSCIEPGLKVIRRIVLN